MRRAAVVTVLAVASCGGGSTKGSETGKPAPSAAATRSASSDPEPEVVEEPSGTPTRAFADSPITRLAEQLVSVVKAAVQGEPLPSVDFPIERRHADEDRLVTGDLPVPRELEFIAFAMELEIALTAGKRAPDGSGPPGEDPPDGIQTMLFLSQHGLKLLSLEPRGVGRAKPAPSWLPVKGLAQQIVSDLRAGGLERWWVGDAE